MTSSTSSYQTNQQLWKQILNALTIPNYFSSSQLHSVLRHHKNAFLLSSLQIPVSTRSQSPWRCVGSNSLFLLGSESWKQETSTEWNSNFGGKKPQIIRGVHQTSSRDQRITPIRWITCCGSVANRSTPGLFDNKLFWWDECERIRSSWSSTLCWFPSLFLLE